VIPVRRMKPGYKLVGVQVLRAVAALCVLVHDAVYYSGLATTDMTSFLHVNLGGIGVYIYLFL
jgi:hypothetical protein